MVCSSVDELIDALRDIGLLRPEQVAELGRENKGQFDEPAALAKHLIKLGWVTPYQARKVLAGKANDLLLGNYIIIDKLGEGGMGKVFKARQTRLSRTVALKVVRPDLIQNELTLKRFLREAKAAARLAHPNIVRLYDADQVGDRHFLAMEYVEGTDLAKLVADKGVLPVGMACSFIRQAATGLQHAHEQGVVHRDLKPSNLLVATTSGKPGKPETGGVVKILDMGLARAGTRENEDATALTQTGTVIGTPDYMSPEQGKNSSTVDGRSDLYSLGCTLFYLLIGRPPFPTGTVLEKLLAHQMDRPPRVDSIRPDVPKTLADIVDKLLAKRPEDRFQDGLELAYALEPFSVWDPHAPELTPSGRFPRPTIAQMVMPTPGDAQPRRNPFDFEQNSAPHIDAVLKRIADVRQPPPAPQAPPAPLKKWKPQAEPPRRRRRVWIGVAAAGLLISIFGLLNALGAFKGKPQDKPSDQDKVGVAAAKKVEPQPIDYCLPPDTELVAVLNFRQLAAGRFFQEHLLPKFADLAGPFKDGMGLDPFKAVEKVVVAVPARTEKYVVLVHLGEGVGRKLLDSAAKQPGVKVRSEPAPGVGGSREIYTFPPPQAGSGEATYGAMLDARSTVFVLSPSRERVVDALTRSSRSTPEQFEDLTLRPALQRYPVKDSTSLWLCAGGGSQMLAFNKKSLPRDNGVDSMTAAMRLKGDGSLACDLQIEAKSRNLAVNGYEHLKSFFRLASFAKKDDQRLMRVSDLLQRMIYVPPAAEPKKDAPQLFTWSTTVPADLFAAWLGPFLD